MSTNNKKHTFGVKECTGEYEQIAPNMLRIRGKINENVSNKRIEVIAAAPPEFRASFSGSGLPFASPKQAFDNTPNQGIIELDANNEFNLKMFFPNAYYAGLGTKYVLPTIYITYNNGYHKKVVDIVVSKGIPYRMLTYPESRMGAHFYDGQDNLPVRTQEQILRDSAYPEVNAMSPDFWGLRPRN